MISQQIPFTAQRPATTVEAASAFQDAWSADPRRVIAGLNLAEALASFGKRSYAADQARRVLEMLDEMGDLPPTALADAIHADVSWMRVSGTEPQLEISAILPPRRGLKPTSSVCACKFCWAT